MFSFGHQKRGRVVEPEFFDHFPRCHFRRRNARGVEAKRQLSHKTPAGKKSGGTYMHVMKNIHDSMIFIYVFIHII